MIARVLIVVNAEWYFWSHRLGLARAARECGCEVVVAAAVERGYRQAIEAQGFRFIPLRLQRRSIAPWREAASLAELFRLYRRERPDLVHHVTIKPVIYGSIAARQAGIPAVVNTVPGLGYTFLELGGTRQRLLRLLVSLAYRLALSGKQVRVIFQNPDNREFFVSRRLVARERTVVIRGSGVDTTQFAPVPEPPGTPLVLLASRMLWDKGVGELVDAARQLRWQGVKCRVVLVGIPDLENFNSVSADTLQGWQSEGVIEWWGPRENMAEVLGMASIVTLPSYAEGVPKILLEAAASGRPIVTTDTPGCREIVRNGENGLLVPPRDPQALAKALSTLLLDPPMRARMGARGREIAVTEFSEEQVIRETLAVYQDLLGERWPRPKQV